MYKKITKNISFVRKFSPRFSISTLGSSFIHAPCTDALKAFSHSDSDAKASTDVTLLDIHTHWFFTRYSANFGVSRREHLSW